MLKKVLEAKKTRLGAQKKQLPLEILKNRVSLSLVTRNFRQALLGQKLSIIAEIKKASPSLGDIAPDLDIVATAVKYEQGGAAAISVLTEEDYFKGAPEFIELVKEVVRIPVLRKDFIFDEYQVYESRYLGADALLLIATILDQKTLSDLVDLALKLNIEPLVEVHTEEDLDKALNTKAKVIGVNNRDLNTFETSLDVSANLIPKIGSDRIKVSESGIKDAGDVSRLKELGVDAILVGETLVKSSDMKEMIASLK